jgi:hypothetical protein
MHTRQDTHSTVHPCTRWHAYTRAQKHTNSRNHAHKNKSGFLKIRPIWVSPSLTLLHHDRNDLSSNLRQETRYADWQFSRFPLFLNKSSEIFIFFFFFFFFFYWRYSPLWGLTFSVSFFHSALSSHCFLHRLTPIICKSSSMPAIHLFRGLPLVLVPIGFHCNILLGVLLSSIRIT